MKISATENEFNKLENRQPQIENPDFTENKIKIDEMKLDIIREYAKVTNTDMKDREPLKNLKWLKQPNANKVDKLCQRRSSTRF